jgi:two-component system, OmpR family, sensor histidine kinase VicK
MSEELDSQLFSEAMDPERLYNQAPCGYISFLPDGRIIKANDTLINWLGFSSDELLDGMKFGDLLSKGGQIHYEMFFRPMLKVSGSVKELSYELQTRSGAVIHVLFGAVGIKDEQGGLLAVNAILTDNRDRKRYEQDLLQARKRAEVEKQRLKHFFMQMPAGVCVLDGPDLVFELVNPLYQQLFPGRVLLGKPLPVAIPEIAGEPIMDIIKGVYETGQTFEGKELLIPLAYSAYGPIQDRYFDFIYQARTNEYDAVDGLLVFVIEVTGTVNARVEIEKGYHEQQALNEELAATNEELTTTNEELSEAQRDLEEIKLRLEAELEAGRLVERQKDAFIGMASHELKTPLTSLNAILQVANSKLKNSPDPFLAGAMSKANIQVKRMTSMINGFLDVSRFESGKMLVDKEWFNLDELVKEMIEEVQLTTRTHIFQIKACESAEISADRDKIGSVLTNLLSNAVKYSTAGSNVEVNCLLMNNQVRVSVKDEGIGARPEDLQKLFERYYRVESPDTRHIAGFGIGLYLSSEIIRQHDGRIWAESELGKGSIFYFSLPLGPRLSS